MYAEIRPSDIIANGRKTTQSGDRQNLDSSPFKKTELTTNRRKVLSFKEYLKTRFGPECKCNACRSTI